MNNKNNIAIIGAGGFGREVFNLINANQYQCIGFIDYKKTEKELPVPIIGHENDMEKLVFTYSFSNCVIAIGDADQRKNIYTKIKEFDIQFPAIVHSSIQSFSKDIDLGTIIYPGVVIMNNCKIGKFSLLNSGVTLGHDVVIGNFCTINPGAHLAGRITIGNGSFIGIGTSIKEEITIGKNAIIGAGSVVLNDVPDGATVYGVPAKAAS